ncbi:MAG: aminoacetone oxidase family FAD-binding enzyme [Tenericutes bacterium]|nr:aminoacetone oxidase family FAD-binding enzyme [Mycoplasmatota bacterium]
MKRIIIVGAGAAGMLAAIHAKTKDNQVILIERNTNCGKKILITGNGKCNYLNDDFNISHYRSDNLEFLENIITEENKKLLISEFKKIGIEPKIKNGYYYPMSNTSISIQNALLLTLKQKGIEIITNTTITDIKKINNKFILNDKFTCDKLIIAAGSSACPKCGTDGTIYDALKPLGLKIKKPLPALVQLKSEGKFLKEWAGIRCDCELSLFENDKLIKKSIGEVQLTDYGISGICTFQLSSDCIRGLDSGKKEVIKMNFLPDIKDFDTFYLNRVKLLKGRNDIELFEGLINYKLLYVLFKHNKNIKEALTSFSLEITGYNGFDKAQVASGGIKLTEINDNFECKNIKDLYIIGEALDVDGDCGGYNLAFAFLSGIIAGESIKND